MARSSSFRERRRRPGSDVEPPRERAVDLGGRVAPHNLDAEAAVLSTILLDGRQLDEILDILPDGRAFYADANRRIYEVAVDLHKQGQPVDIQTVANELRLRDRLNAIGGVSYLTKIVDATPSIAHVRAHAKIVFDLDRVRQLAEQCQLTAAETYGDYGNAQTLIDKHEQAVFDLGRTHERTELRHITSAVDKLADLVARAHRGPGGITGYPSGFDSIDEQTGGFHPGDLTIIAARPGMGKTSYVLAIAQHLAEIAPKVDEVGDLVLDDEGRPIEPGYAIAIWSLEMPEEQLAARLACMKAGIEVSRIRRGKLGKDYGTFLAHLEVAKKLPIYLDEASGITTMDVRAKLRRLRRAHPKRKILAIIDYLQLMRGREGVHSREEQVSEISRELKAIAKELGIPMIALSQLNRDVEKRAAKDRRPVLSDLRESGSIEQDADNVQFIYRPEYYSTLANDDVPPEEQGYAEVITAKQRNGPTGPKVVAFRGPSTRFENATVSDMQRWGLDGGEKQPEQKKMFAPGSKLPGASQGN